MVDPRDELLPWALKVIATERDDELQVFADRVIEMGWFDERVITVCMFPPAPSLRRATDVQRRDRRRAVMRLRSEARTIFNRCSSEARYSAAHTWRWVRAVAAVLMFRDWPERPFGLIWHATRAAREQNEVRISSFGGLDVGGFDPSPDDIAF